jgi:hypothetical protein
MFNTGREDSEEEEKITSEIIFNDIIGGNNEAVEENSFDQEQVIKWSKANTERSFYQRTRDRILRPFSKQQFKIFNSKKEALRCFLITSIVLALFISVVGPLVKTKKQSK